MFNLFSKKPKPPSQDAMIKLEEWLSCVSKHVAAHFDFIPTADMWPQWPTPGFDERKQHVDTLIKLDKATSELNAARLCLNEARRVWPDGRKIFKDLDDSLSCLLEVLSNTKTIHTLLDSDNNRDFESITAEVQKIRTLNKQLLHQAEKYGEAGSVKLKEFTGIEI